MLVKKLNMMKYADIENKPLETITKIRYKDPGASAIISQKQDSIEVLFNEPVIGIAPGQAAVFYEGDDIVGGGWIMKSFKQNADVF